LTGSARFDRDRPMNLTLSGSVNLRLLKGVLPAMSEQGRADVNVSIQGTITQPQIVGRATVHDA
jgi:autotransporter translocation and assembly factor TamB